MINMFITSSTNNITQDGGQSGGESKTEQSKTLWITKKEVGKSNCFGNGRTFNCRMVCFYHNKTIGCEYL